MVRSRSAKNQYFLTTAQKILSFSSCIVVSDYCQPKAPKSPKNKIILQISRPGFFFRFSQEIRRVYLFPAPPCAPPNIPHMHKRLFSLSKSYPSKIIPAKSCLLFLSPARSTMTPCEVVVRSKDIRKTRIGPKPASLPGYSLLRLF